MTLRGAPDDYQLRPRSATHPVGDMAELAARLGSIVTYDRRGDVVFMEDFEQGLNRWGTATYNGGSTVGLSVAHARSGACSVKLRAAGANSSYARITTYAPYRTLSKLGLEVAFTLGAYVDYLSWAFTVYTGARFIKAAARYYPDTELLRVQTGSTSWYDVDTALDMYAQDYLFRVLKLVVDLEAEEYVRLLLDTHEYDLSAQTPWCDDSGTAPHIWVELKVTAEGIFPAEIYIDDVIITQDEP